MFERYVSIDWSGAGMENQAAHLAVAEASSVKSEGWIVPCPGGRQWTRALLREWLTVALGPEQPRTIVAMDFGFSLPWGADKAVFDRNGWRNMVAEIARLYAEKGTARLTAEFINANPRFCDHGPFRFNENRTDFRFYMDSNVAYYRMVELAVPQAISEWYVGSGAAVGFSTITGLAALHYLMCRREEERIDFQVWPQECDSPDPNKHLVVECYPAICPKCDNGPFRTNDERDAWKVLQWLLEVDRTGKLEKSFQIKPKPFGRIEGVSFEEQIRFEGWILGVD